MHNHNLVGGAEWNGYVLYLFDSVGGTHGDPDARDKCGRFHCQYWADLK
jgi:hypothetical protein